MKKIVHIIIGLNVGGAELMLKRLVLHSQEKKQFCHEVISLTELGIVGESLKKQGIPVHVIGMNSFFSFPKAYFKLYSLIREIRPDVVQTWMYHADFLGGIVARKLKIKKIIWSIRTTDVSLGGSRLTITLRKFCAKLSYNIPSDIICAAQVARDTHIKVGYDTSKMHVIPNGFEIDRLKATAEDRIKIRQELNIPINAIVIGSVGRFNIIKNQRMFIEIAAELTNLYPDLIFMIVGRDNTENNEELISWINKYNLKNRFKLLGQRNDIPKCLKAMDIFCLHSKTEGFPNVLGEAMIAKTPVAALDVGDSRYIVNNDNYIGKNKEDLVNIIISIINKEDNLEAIVNQNFNRIKNNFSLLKVVESYESLYQDIDRV